MNRLAWHRAEALHPEPYVMPDAGLVQEPVASSPALASVRYVMSFPPEEILVPAVSTIWPLLS